MGGVSSKCCQNANTNDVSDNAPVVAKATQRENMATWHRTDIPVTDVYEIVETIGKGHMGEVYKVKRLVEDRGLHNNITRNKSFGLDSSQNGNKSFGLDSSQHGSISLNPLPKAPTTEEINRNEEKKPKPILRKPSRGNLLTLASQEPQIASDPVRIDYANDNPKDLSDNPAVENSLDGESVCSIRSVSGKISSFMFDEDEASVGSNVSGTGTPFRKSKRNNRLRFQRNFACKTVSTTDIKGKELAELLNEIYIMRSLDHPYIIRLYEVYQVRNKLWMIMDLCTGGNLTTRKLNESQVTIVTEEILRGVVYLHRNGVCHRDLKLENILYEHSGLDATIRLIDFGISAKYDHSSGSGTSSGGAVYTMSPEISAGTGPYTTKSDVWAIGVIVWVLLAGDYPFLRRDSDLNDKEKRAALNNADYDYGVTWRGRGITSEAKRFVAGCLRKSTQKRWSAEQALSFLKETWVPGLEEKNEQKKVFKRKKLEISMNDFLRFCECGLLKQTILITMANTMDRSEVGDLQELFLLVDSEQTGTINISELTEAFVKLGIPTQSDEEIQKIFTMIDHDHSGQIHYAEFLAALAESHGLVTTDRLSDAFDRIDSSGKGFITHDDLKAILGENYDADTVDKMIEEGDFKKNGQVDYDEVQQLMFGEESEKDLIDLHSFDMKQ